jgi:hypothetical protein
MRAHKTRGIDPDRTERGSFARCYSRHGSSCSVLFLEPESAFGQFLEHTRAFLAT